MERTVLIWKLGLCIVFRENYHHYPRFLRKNRMGSSNGPQTDIGNYAGPCGMFGLCARFKNWVWALDIFGPRATCAANLQLFMHASTRLWNPKSNAREP